MVSITTVEEDVGEKECGADESGARNAAVVVVVLEAILVEKG